MKTRESRFNIKHRSTVSFTNAHGIFHFDAKLEIFTRSKQAAKGFGNVGSISLRVIKQDEATAQAVMKAVKTMVATNNKDVKPISTTY